MSGKTLRKLLIQLERLEINSFTTSALKSKLSVFSVLLLYSKKYVCTKKNVIAILNLPKFLIKRVFSDDEEDEEKKSFTTPHLMGKKSFFLQIVLKVLISRFSFSTSFFPLKVLISKAFDS